MPPNNTSFVSLGKLAACLDTNVDELLFDARMGNLKLCAETSYTNARPSGTLKMIRKEMGSYEGNPPVPEWIPGHYFIWLQASQVTEIVVKGSIEIKGAHYPYHTGGSARHGRVAYREETITFQELCTLKKESLLVLDGEAAHYYAKMKGLSPILTNTSDNRMLRLNRNGKLEGGVYKTYSLHEVFRKEVLMLESSSDTQDIWQKREDKYGHWLEEYGHKYGEFEEGKWRITKLKRPGIWAKLYEFCPVLFPENSGSVDKFFTKQNLASIDLGRSKKR